MRNRDRRLVTTRDWEVPYARKHMTALLRAARDGDKAGEIAAMCALCLHGLGQVLPRDEREAAA